MFKDARQLDTQRTAASFEKAQEKYAATAETWFDGSVGSVDKRLAACDRLLHSTRFTVARLSINESQRYLEAAQGLESDRRALLALRSDLLNGASDREDVSGPPGWRTANPTTKLPGSSAGSNKLENPAPRTKTPRWMDDDFEPRFSAPRTAAHWFNENSPEGRTWLSSLAPHQPDPRHYHSPEEYRHAYSLSNRLNYLNEQVPGGGDHPVRPTDQSSGGGRLEWASTHQATPAGYNDRMPYPPSNMNESLKPVWQGAIDAGQDPIEAVQLHTGQRTAMPHEPQWDDAAGDWAVPTMEEDMTGQVGAGFEPVRPTAGLSGQDRRWVTLEAAKFVAANHDTLDDSHELATRAHNHAATQTSTFTAQRSAAICRAFVGEVSDLGQRTARHQPVRVASAPLWTDWSDQAMYLL